MLLVCPRCAERTPSVCEIIYGGGINGPVMSWLIWSRARAIQCHTALLCSVVVSVTRDCGVGQVGRGVLAMNGVSCQPLWCNWWSHNMQHNMNSQLQSLVCHVCSEFVRILQNLCKFKKNYHGWNVFVEDQKMHSLKCDSNWWMVVPHSVVQKFKLNMDAQLQTSCTKAPKYNVVWYTFLLIGDILRSWA